MTILEMLDVLEAEIRALRDRSGVDLGRGRAAGKQGLESGKTKRARTRDVPAKATAGATTPTTLAHSSLTDSSLRESSGLPESSTLPENSARGGEGVAEEKAALGKRQALGRSLLQLRRSAVKK